MAERESDFKITSEEATRIRKAMKDAEFRKLLTEYAQEITDPENRATYEREIAELERQRGVNIQFLRPTAGFVMKVFTKPEEKKIFVNVCQNENVKAAVPTPVEDKGDQWMIPYSLTGPREDLDKAGKKCCVIDAVFHPETYKKGQQNPRFKKLLVDTVLDGIEKNLSMPLDRENIVYLRMPYKGVPTSTVLRERTKDPYTDSAEGPDLGPLKVPYPPLKEELEAKAHKKQQEKKEKEKRPSEPEYSIVHRGEMSMQDFTNERTSSKIKRPKELVVSVQLPGVESAKSVELDIFEKRLLLQCNKPLYKLDLALPYPINEDNGSAKFNKSKKSLVITLPVLPLRHPPPQAPPTRPLVSELPNDASSNGVTETESHDIKEEVSGVKEDTKQEEVVGVVPEVTKDWTSKGEWLCPPFTYRQDDNCVYFMLQTSGVKRSSMVSHFDEHQVQLTYSTTSGQNYSFVVSFPPGYGLDSDDCSVDISEDNIVLVLVKNDESCCKEWNDFTMGLKSAQTKEEKLFLTANNVQSAIEKVNSSEGPWEKRNGWSESAQFEVTSLSDDHMEVKVTEQERSEKLLPQASSNGTGAKEHEREKGSSASGTAEGKPQSPSSRTMVDDKTEPKSKPTGGKEDCKDNSTEPELDLKQEAQKEEKAMDSGASSTVVEEEEANSTCTRQDITPSLGNTDSKLEGVIASKGNDSQEAAGAHSTSGNRHKKENDNQENSVTKSKDESGGGEMTATSSRSKEKGASEESVEPSGSSLSAGKDYGSVFTKAEEDHGEAKPLPERMAKTKNQEKGSKIQFSNQLAFSLD